MLIPGWIVALVTFPGVIVHEIAHEFFCRKTNTLVYDVCYFRLGNPAGYVLHGEPPSYKATFLIAVGPFLVNTMVCALLALPVSIKWFFFNTFEVSGLAGIFYSLIGWIGISSGMHVFPSAQDMDHLTKDPKFKEERKALLGKVGWIFSGLFAAARVLSVIWFDLLYAILVAIVSPLVIITIVKKLIPTGG